MAAAIVAAASIIPVLTPALHNYTELFPSVGQP
jgi:hypothetical protein